MKLDLVTLTGADESIDSSMLFEISEKYPFVEWGILLSRNSAGQRRFPSHKWLNKLEENDWHIMGVECMFSGHLCGSYVRELLMGDTKFIKEIGNSWDLFQRVQINTHGIKHEYDEVKLLNALAQYPEKEFIFQYDNVNKDILDYVMANSEINVSTLFDLSHGAGVLPDEWPLPLNGIRCGYAGGLSPENVEEQIKLIESKVFDNSIWIDMETKIRSNNGNLFDLDKCEDVLMTCESYI